MMPKMTLKMAALAALVHCNKGHNMYKGFNLTLNNSFFDYKLQQDISIIKRGILNQNEANKDKIRKDIKELIKNNNSISANDIILNWFRISDYDIFLSHSHSDKNLAINLASWLNLKFGLRTFIDSCIWGNFIDLARDLNNSYSLTQNNNYDYDKAQNVFTHVNALLNTSLTNMINRCESVFFLNTDNSIAESSYTNQDITLSPWIYHELLITKVIEKIKPRPSLESLTKSDFLAFDSINESLIIEYDAEISHLFNLDNAKLKNWEILYNKNIPNKIKSHPLDILYLSTGRNNMYG